MIIFQALPSCIEASLNSIQLIPMNGILMNRELILKQFIPLVREREHFDTVVIILAYKNWKRYWDIKNENVHC